MGSLVRACACMYVCLSITGLQLKCTGLCIAYIPFHHMLLMVLSLVMRRQAREHALSVYLIDNFPLAVHEAHDA